MFKRPDPKKFEPAVRRMREGFAAAIRSSADHASEHFYHLSERFEEALRLTEDMLDAKIGRFEYSRQIAGLMSKNFMTYRRLDKMVEFNQDLAEVYWRLKQEISQFNSSMKGEVFDFSRMLPFGLGQKFAKSADKQPVSDQPEPSRRAPIMERKGKPFQFKKPGQS